MTREDFEVGSAKSLIQAQGKIPQIDVIRGIAIIGVFLYHLYGAVFGIDNFQWAGDFKDYGAIPSKWFAVFYPYHFGFLGVPLFFILSGFCIHLSFLKKEKYSHEKGGKINLATYTKQFLVKRLIRIYPIYLIALLLFIFVIPIAPLEPAQRSLQLWLHIFMVHNFHQDTFYGVNPSFWSIAVEFQLYLIYPILLYFRSKFGIGKTIFLITFFSLSYGQIAYAADLQIQSIAPHSYVIGGLTIFSKMPFIFWWIQWAAGAFLAESMFKGKTIFEPNARQIGLIMITSLISSQYNPAYVFHIFVFVLLSIIWIQNYTLIKRKINQIEIVLANIGVVSYSFYLVHQPLLIHFPNWISKLPKLQFNYLQNPFLSCTLIGLLLFIPIYLISLALLHRIEVPTYRLAIKLSDKLKR
ncbi:acyltransferase 3 [Thalassoporum mexicanum PCC 7367]|uniref:acyltransferase family protein n=1 Tax=Thalassoporum mexicanum TaxID=3457544 RepID=UPI00029FE2ED|nr:acyltransferase [Pseudanabaena sp. PCC 7367]AFY71804.1 acyltransferase 3 [Pseudanabaena sp. PCC 7367]